VVPANPGVNPSLTITALAEHAMTFVPPAVGAVAETVPQASAAALGGGVDAKHRPAGEPARHEVGEPAKAPAPRSRA
jgi:hypothetical protein